MSRIGTLFCCAPKQQWKLDRRLYRSPQCAQTSKEFRGTVTLKVQRAKQQRKLDNLQTLIFQFPNWEKSSFTDNQIVLTIIIKAVFVRILLKL